MFHLYICKTNKPIKDMANMTEKELDESMRELEKRTIERKRLTEVNKINLRVK